MLKVDKRILKRAVAFLLMVPVPLWAAGHLHIDKPTSEGSERVRPKESGQLNEQYLALCGEQPPKTGESKPLDKETLAALELLQSKCANCHKPGSTTGANSFDDILNAKQLTNRNIVTAGSPEESTLIERIEDGSMPMGQEELTPTQKDLLKNWIRNGAKSFKSGSLSVPEVGFVSQADFEACMFQDIRSLPPEDRPFVRYLNLGNLFNSERQDELDETRLALNKLLNSLSWQSQIKNPVVIDGTQTLIRIDLRDYRWTSEMWEEISANNPYPEKLEGAKSRGLTQMTQTSTPYVRGDWFVFKGSRPPLYHKLLFDLPKISHRVGNKNADKALEDLLSVDVVENEQTGDLVKAGFKQSNVTKSNRTIERHETPFGSYWKSDDFKKRVGRQNIFEHPLDYQKDGGEFIFSLPNGLHGYLITDAAGDRLEGAPTDVVVDPNRIQEDGVVLNGVSCMNCHQRGIKKQDDDMLDHFKHLEELLSDPTLKRRSYLDGPPIKVDYKLKDVLEDVKRIYKGNEALNRAFAEDEKAYTTAIQKTENSVERADPVFAVGKRFEAPLDIKTVAAELGYEAAQVEEFFKNNIEVRQKLAFGKQAVIDRDTFNQNFRELKVALDHYTRSRRRND